LKLLQANPSSQSKIKSKMPVAIFGQTGLIGNAIRNEFQDNLFEIKITQWTESEIVSTWSEITNFASSSNLSIDLVWAAGAANNSSDELVIREELKIIDTLIELIKLSSRNLRTLNLISSAGSIYAGSKVGFIDAETVPVPNSLYGQSRIAIEDKFMTLANSIEIPLNIYRLTNVYGYKERIKQNSGLISHLINANLTRKELNIFVPLYVEQDYIDVEFVAKNIYSNIMNNKSFSNQIQIYCRNQSHSIIELISIIDKFMGRKSPFVTHEIASSSYRQYNLRFKVDYSTYNMIPIQPLNFSIKKLINEMTYAKIS
jgi:nucleoside-diphosphate-sugar epimerase